MTSLNWRGASDNHCSAVEIVDTCTSADPTKVVRKSIHHRALFFETRDRTGVIKCSVLW